MVGSWDGTVSIWRKGGEWGLHCRYFHPQGKDVCGVQVRGSLVFLASTSNSIPLVVLR